MRIVTLTLSPAFDVHCGTKSFMAERENLMDSLQRGIGGKGINISRALTENGTKNLALVVVGDENGDDFLRGMDVCGLTERKVITVKGRIRENITVHPEVGAETRISFKGFTAEPTLFESVSRLTEADQDTVVTFTGSLPGGIGGDAAEAFLDCITRTGARLVIDSKSVTLDMLIRLKPWLIKPNSEELSVYFGELDENGVVEAAKRLHADGIGNALISLGEKGAVLACDEGVFMAKPPHIEAVSTIGAGDSMIAGFIAAAKEPAEVRLRTAIAYGTAACLTEGTNPPKPSKIKEIARVTEVIKVL